MKKLMSVFCAFSFSLLQAVGFDASTLVTLANGSVKPIKEVVVGDNVVCYNKEFERFEGAVQGTAIVTMGTTVQITTQDNITMIASCLELFFLPDRGEWLIANELKVGDCLLNDDLESIAITAIQQSSELHEMYVISVDKQPNFLASEGKYLVHNGPIAAWQAYCATKAALYGLLGLSVVGGVFAANAAIAAAETAIIAGSLTPSVMSHAVDGIALLATVGSKTDVAIDLALKGAAMKVSPEIVEVTNQCISAVRLAKSISGGVPGVTGELIAVGGNAVGCPEIGEAAGACATGAGVVGTVAASTTGVCGMIAAAIETAALSAFAAALVCPWTPW